MPVDQNKAMIGWFLLEGFNERNLEVVDRVFAPDHLLHSPADGDETTEGVEPVKSMVEDFFGLAGEGAAAECTILKQVAEGAWVSTYYSLQAINLTSGGPTDDKYWAVIISRFADGKAQESFVVAQEAYPTEEKRVFN